LPSKILTGDCTELCVQRGGSARTKILRRSAQRGAEILSPRPWDKWGPSRLAPWSRQIENHCRRQIGELPCSDQKFDLLLSGLLAHFADYTGGRNEPCLLVPIWAEGHQRTNQSFHLAVRSRDVRSNTSPMRIKKWIWYRIVVRQDRESPLKRMQSKIPSSVLASSRVTKDL
jgi:hypothetical protein